MRSITLRAPSALALGLALFFALGACSTTVKETRYYAIENAQGEVNVYKLDIHATAFGGEAEYASGWYPKTSVDSLTGAVNAEQAVDDLKTRRDIEAAINESVLKAYKNWLTVAGNEDSTQDKRDKVFDTLRLVLAYPANAPGEDEGIRYIEYNPAAGVVVRHSDEKMVFTLSSDPTKILNAINNFTQSNETAASIDEFATLFGKQSVEKLSAVQAETNATQMNFGRIQAQLDSLVEDGPAEMEKSELAARLTTLSEMLDAME